MKTASRFLGKPYTCQKPWPDDCNVQCGDRGIVFKRKSKDSYYTAFFEAFPKNPSTFIRGEGTTVEEAERRAYELYLKYKVCDHPKFDRKGYTNGGCFCVKCGMFSSHLMPTTACILCNKKTDYDQDINGDWYCEDCKIPEDKKTEFQKRFECED